MSKHLRPAPLVAAAWSIFHLYTAVFGSMPAMVQRPIHLAFGLSLASVYQGEGCASAVAGSAAEAERELQSRLPDLVVVRAELPDLSGFSLCGRLRRDHPGLPVILFSSESSPEALAEHARMPAEPVRGD